MEQTGQLEKMKQTADFLMNNNLTAFIKDIYGNWFIGKIVLLGDLRITVDCTEGKRQGKREYIIWSNVEYVDEKKGVRD